MIGGNDLELSTFLIIFFGICLYLIVGEEIQTDCRDRERGVSVANAQLFKITHANRQNTNKLSKHAGKQHVEYLENTLQNMENDN